MIIRNIVESGKTLENAFMAQDDLGNCLGRCQARPVMLPYLLPDYPLNIEISAEGREEVRLQLLAAAMARSLQIARKDSVRTRVYARCRPGNDLMMERLKSLGFVDDDALVRMRQRIVPGAMARPLPEGCVLVADELSDAAERRFFVDRFSRVFGQEDAAQWLNGMVQKPLFRRFLLTSRSGLAGELLCWVEDGEGVIGVVYTAPAWRRKGVAAYLMEKARLYFCEKSIPEAIIDVRWRIQPALKLAASVGYRRSETLWRLPGIDVDLPSGQN